MIEAFRQKKKKTKRLIDKDLFYLFQRSLPSLVGDGAGAVDWACAIGQKMEKTIDTIVRALKNLETDILKLSLSLKKKEVFTTALSLFTLITDVNGRSSLS